jgi:hypothetical protein
VSKVKQLSQVSSWKPKARERAVFLALIGSPIAMVMSLFCVLVLVKAMNRIEKPADTYSAITDVTRVQNFARNSLLLWMGGSQMSERPLLARSSASKSIELSEVPFEVRSIEPSDIERWRGSGGKHKGLFGSKEATEVTVAEWRVTFAVTYVAPGSGTVQISRYAVTVLERDHDYQLLLWPSIVNNDTTVFRVESKYVQPIGEKTPLADSLNRFVTAYLTSTGGATSLGQYVSSQFHGSAIVDSPYTEATIESIKSAEGDPQLSTAKPGTQLRILVRVKASSSIKTWSIMDLALRVSLGTNNVWLVDSIDSPIGWGAVTGG